jgi:hypothetical protein
LLTALKPDSGTLLDAGYGGGDFLALMQTERHWHVAGLEINAAAVC